MLNNEWAVCDSGWWELSQLLADSTVPSLANSAQRAAVEMFRRGRMVLVSLYFLVVPIVPALPDRETKPGGKWPFEPV